MRYSRQIPGAELLSLSKILTTVGLILAFSTNTAAAPSCHDLFSLSSISSVKRSMHLNLSQPQEFVRKLEMSQLAVNKMRVAPKGSLPSGFAGNLALRGGESHIVIVEIGGKKYALKVFRRRGTEPELVGMSTQYSIAPLVIQHALGSLQKPAAPTLEGLVPRRRLLPWVNAHLGQLAEYGISNVSQLKYAVLMEFCSTPSEKVAPELYDDVPHDRFKELDSDIRELGIESGDIDYIFNSSGEVVFVDFGYFSVPNP